MRLTQPRAFSSLNQQPLWRRMGEGAGGHQGKDRSRDQTHRPSLREALFTDSGFWAHVRRVWRNDMVVGWLVPKESRALHLFQGPLCHSGRGVAEGSRFTSAKGGWKPLPQVLSQRGIEIAPQEGICLSPKGEPQAVEPSKDSARAHRQTF